MDNKEPNNSQNQDTDIMPEGTAPTASQSEAPENKSSVGPIVGVIIVVAIIVIGGLYFWGERLSQTDETPDEVTEQLGQTSASDEISDIEADLDATTLDALDGDLGDIDTEFGP